MALTPGSPLFSGVCRRPTPAHVPSNPVSVVLRCLLWQVLVIFTDEPYESFPVEALDLGRRATLVMTDANNESDVEMVLDQNSDPIQSSTLFVIKCPTTCILNILHKVNIHDMHYQEQGALTYRPRWLIVADDSVNLTFIQHHVGNITNLSVLMLKDEPGTCNVYSASWTPVGRRFELSARITNGSISGEVFPTLKYGLNGRKFRVTITTWAPFISETTDDNGMANYSGFSIETLQIIADQMNFTYEFTKPPDGQWGDVVNGTWTGLVAQLAYKTADMMAAPLAVQARREYVMDSTFPFYIEETAFIYKHSPSQLLEAFLFVRPYKWQVWVCFGMVILGIGLVAWCLEQIMNRTYWQDRITVQPLYENIWIVYGAAFCQGTSNKAMSHVVRLVFIFWLFVCVAYTATYSSNLVALLSVEVVQTPFRTLEELATQQDYRYGVQGASVYTSIIRNSQGIYKTMWRRMEKWESEGFPATSTSHQAQMDLVDKGHYAYLTDSTSALIHTAGACDLRLFRDKLFPLQYAMGFQNNSAYSMEASKVIMKLSQTGLLTKWIKQYWPKQTSCLKPTPNASISVKDLSGLFCVTLALLIMSSVVLCMELFACPNKRKLINAIKCCIASRVYHSDETE